MSEVWLDRPESPSAPGDGADLWRHSIDGRLVGMTTRGGLGGVETLAKLLEVDPGVKAVVSNGYADDAALSDSRQLGFRAFLKKPYDIAEPQSTLGTLLT